MKEGKPEIMLAELADNISVAVIGASGGIGDALIEAAAKDPKVGRLHALSRRRPDHLPEAATFTPIDITDEASIEAAARALDPHGPLDVVIIATGLLHDGADFQPEKDWRHLSAANLSRAFAVNTIGPALVAKHVLPLMNHKRHAVFAALSARVGSISDNKLGGWYGYRASKAALNMVLRNLAIELQRKRSQCIAVGLHPGTVETRLSEPFQANTRPGQVVVPREAAGNLWSVIGRLGPEDSGGVFAWDGQRIPE